MSALQQSFFASLRASLGWGQTCDERRKNDCQTNAGTRPPGPMPACSYPQARGARNERPRQTQAGGSGCAVT